MIDQFNLRSFIESKNNFDKWSMFFRCMLDALEINDSEYQEAKMEYKALARKIASKLSIDVDDVNVFPQGSMATQTTISPRGNHKFDLDIVVKFCGEQFNDIEPNDFFNTFGDTLKQCHSKDDRPSPKRRCWRLQFPNKPFYFDVTPALPDSMEITGTDLRVRDPNNRWSPSNPEEFKDWFCTAAKQTPLFMRKTSALVVDSATIEDLPNEPVGVDDILRRTVQLTKLHRDFEYFRSAPDKQERKPISVIIVTLLTHAYTSVFRDGTDAKLDSPISFMLEIIERMPNFITQDGKSYQIVNPVHEDENFAERWNTDNYIRAKEFYSWHAQLKKDFFLLFSKEFIDITIADIESIFGENAANIWRDNFVSANGLNASLFKKSVSDILVPTTPIPMGTKNTLA